MQEKGKFTATEDPHTGNIEIRFINGTRKHKIISVMTVGPVRRSRVGVLPSSNDEPWAKSLVVEAYFFSSGLYLGL